VGAVDGQAYYFQNKGPVLANLLVQGWTPAQIVAEMNRVAALPANSNGLVDPTQDPHGLYDVIAQARQYEITSLTAPPATFTGSDHTSPGTNMPYFSSATSGQVGTDRFIGAAAGNTLSSTDMAPTMAGALQSPPKDIVTALAEVGVTVAPQDVAAMHKGDLAERLFLSLEAAFGRPGQGDLRCLYNIPEVTSPPTGPLPWNTRSSSTAYLRVDNADGTTAMNLRYRSINNRDAVRSLAQMYYDCRMGRASCTASVDDTSAAWTNQNFSYSVSSQSGNVLGAAKPLAYASPLSGLTSAYDGRNLTLTINKYGNDGQPALDSWTLQMTPPRGVNWVNGTTYHVEGGARTNVAAFNVTHNGVQCSRPFGTLKMNSVAFSSFSTVTAISADFSNVTCQGMSGTLAGQVRFFG
jgi:hypothetical protein